MIDEEKVRLMCRLASYENNEGKNVLPVTGYFRTDYISAQLLKSFLSGTIAFLSIVAILIFYNFEFIMQDIYNIEIVEFGKKVLTNYAVLMGIYLVLTYIVAVYRYNRAKKSLKGYYSNLKKLWKMSSGS